MKKLMICTAALLLALTGCSKKDSAAGSSSQESSESSGMISMDAAGFTDNQAETLMTSVVSKHCAQVGIACQVTAAEISGDDVVANYQYARGGKVAYANATITDVKVNSDNMNEVTYVSAKFEDGSIKIDNGAQETADTKTDESIPKFDVPSATPDPSEEDAKDDVTLVSESGVRLHRIYVTRSNFVADGTYEGTGRLRVILMDMNQNVEEVAVDQTGSGDFHTVTPITEGYHYMLLMVEDGEWSLQWSALPDDMLD